MKKHFLLISIISFLLLTSWLAYAAIQSTPASDPIPSDVFLDAQYGAPGFLYRANNLLDGTAVTGDPTTLFLNATTTYAGAHDNQYSELSLGVPGLIWNGTNWQPFPGQLLDNSAIPAPAVLADVAANGSNQFVVTSSNLAEISQPDDTTLPAAKIAFWDGTEWQTLGGGLNWTCNLNNGCQVALADDGTIYAANTSPFTAVADPSTNLGFVAQWDGTSWQNMSNGLPAAFFDITLDDLLLAPNGDLYLHGRFDPTFSLGDEIMAYRWDGTAWQPLLANADIPKPLGDGNLQRVPALLAEPDGTLTFSAHGTTFNDTDFDEFTAVYQRATNGTVTQLAPAFFLADLTAAYPDLFDPPIIHALTRDAQGDLIAGGFFYGEASNGDPLRSLARWDGTNWQPLATGVDLQPVGATSYQSHITTLLTLPDGVYAHGRFQHIGDITALNIARWDSTTQSWSALCADACNGLTFSPDFNPIVYDFAWDDTNQLIVSGRFEGAGQTIAANVARWDPLTLTWSALGDGLNLRDNFGTPNTSYVYGVTLFQDQLVAGGRFNHTADTPLTSHALAQWDENSQTWQAFPGGGTEANINAQIRSLLADGDQLYIVGDFAQIGSLSLPNGEQNRAVWEASTQTWQPLAGSNKFIADSDFNRTEKLHASPTSDSIYFTPELLRWDGTAFQRTLNMEMDGRYGYLSGDFTMLDGQPYSYVARFDSQTGQWDDMNGGLPGPVNYTYDTVGGDKAFVVGNIAHLWNGTAWNGTITLPEPQVAGGNIDAEAFFANGDVFGRFTYWPPQDFPANSPTYFVWNELDKSVTLHPSPSGVPATPLPSYYGQGIAHAPNPNGSEVVVAMNYGHNDDDGGTYWQLFRYDLNTQVWEAITSETAGDYLNPTPYALTSFGSHIYFGGDFQEVGDKVALGFGRWVQTSADLAVRQSVSNPAVAVGVPFEVVLEVENLGPDTAVSTALTNTLPSELTFSSVSQSQGTCAHAGQLLTCELGTIIAGNTAVVTLTAIPQSATTFTNTVTALAQTIDTDLSNNSATLAITAGDFADVRVSRTQPATLTASQPATLTWHIHNDGQAPAYSVVLSDTLPLSATVTTLDAPQGSCAAWLDGLRCDVGTLEAQTGITITAVVAAGMVTPTQSSAYTAVVSTLSLESNTQNNSDSGTFTVQPFGADVALLLDVSATTTSYTATLTVSNATSQPAPQASATAELPVGATLTGYAATQGSCAGVGTITCTLGTLAENSTAVVTLTASLNEAGNLATYATASSAAPDPDPSNNGAQAITPRPTAADLSLRKQAQTAVPEVGATQVYQVSLENGGPDTAVGIILTDTLPTGQDFLAATLPDGACQASGQTVVCTLAGLAVNGRATALISATVTMTSTEVTTATVSAITADPDLSNNTAVVQGAVSPPTTDLRLTSDLPLTPTVRNVGDPLSYTLTVQNSGDLPSEVTLSHASEVSFTAVPSQGTCTAVTCTLGTLDAGQSATVQITAETPAVGAFVLTHLAVGSAPETTLGNNGVTAFWQGAVLADTVVFITTTTPLPTVGDTYHVDVTVRNGGAVALDDLQLRYLSPVSSTLVSLPAGLTCDTTQPEIACALPPLSGNAAQSFIFQWRGDVPSEGWHVVSVASASVPEDVALLGDNQASLRVVPGGVLLALQDAPTTITTTLNGTAVYEVTVANNGSRPAPNVEATFQLPPTVALVSGANCEAVAQTAVCAVGNVGVGQMAPLVLELRGVAEGSGVITAVVAASAPEGDWTDNTAVTQLQVGQGTANPTIYLPLIMR